MARAATGATAAGAGAGASGCAAALAATRLQPFPNQPPQKASHRCPASQMDLMVMRDDKPPKQPPAGLVNDSTNLIGTLGTLVPGAAANYLVPHGRTTTSAVPEPRLPMLAIRATLRVTRIWS